MKEKKKFKVKKVFKNSIFTFVLGALIFGTIGVGASTLLYSKDVTYDNSSSGLSSTNLQDALDELYEQASSGGTSVSCDGDGNCTVTCKEGSPTITDSGYSCTTTTTVTCPSGTSFFPTSTGYKCTKQLSDVLTAASLEYSDGLGIINWTCTDPTLTLEFKAYGNYSGSTDVSTATLRNTYTASSNVSTLNECINWLGNGSTFVVITDTSGKYEGSVITNTVSVGTPDKCV